MEILDRNNKNTKQEQIIVVIIRNITSTQCIAMQTWQHFSWKFPLPATACLMATSFNHFKVFVMSKCMPTDKKINNNNKKSTTCIVKTLLYH